MYKISKITGGSLPKVLRGQIDATYEQVRSGVRKFIRSKYETKPGENPPISLYGFRIQQVSRPC